MSYPKRLDIELNNTCQLSCNICPRGLGKMNRPLGNMDPALVERIVRESSNRVNIIWGHVFGDPLLYPELLWALKLFRATGAWVGISTNAVALDHAMSEAILRTDIDWLILSLDSLDKERYESIRRGAIFENTLANIDNCIDIRRQIPESKTRLIVQIIDLEDSEKEIEAAKQRFDTRLEGIGEVFHKWFSTYGGKVPDCAGKIISPMTGICEMLDRALVILWNGDATICCHDVAGEYVIGNIGESSIEEIWNSEKRIKIHDNIRVGRFDGLEICRNCIRDQA